MLKAAMSKRQPPKYRAPAGSATGAYVRQKAQRSSRLSASRAIGYSRRTPFPPELKFYDTTLGFTAVAGPTDASGGEMDPSATSMISTPAVGDGEQSRDGKRIIIKNVQIKGVLNKDASEDAGNPNGGAIVTVYLVLDTQSNGAQLNSEDVFKNLSGSAGLAAQPLRNLLFGPRFRIIKSETFDFNTPTSAEGDNLHSSAGLQRCFEWFQKMDMIVNFNAGTTASIANVIDNSLHVIAYASNTSPAITLAYNARIRFEG